MTGSARSGRNAWLDTTNEVRGLDLAVLPMGVVEFEPFTGERRVPADHPILRHEATFAQTLSIVDVLGAKRTVLSAH